MLDKVNVSVRGKRKSVPALQVCGVTVLLKGRLFKTAEIFDEYWLERDLLPNPELLVAELYKGDDTPDLLTFTQRIPDVDPMYNYYYELDNYAVVPLSTYERWFKEQIPATTRRHIRASEKRGIVIRVCEYNDDYVSLT